MRELRKHAIAAVFPAPLSFKRRVVHRTGRQIGGPFKAALPERDPGRSGAGRGCSALENQSEHEPKHEDALRAVYGDADQRTAVAL